MKLTPQQAKQQTAAAITGYESSEYGKERRWGNKVLISLILGVALTVITSIIPYHADNCAGVYWPYAEPIHSSSCAGADDIIYWGWPLPHHYNAINYYGPSQKKFVYGGYVYGKPLIMNAVFWVAASFVGVVVYDWALKKGGRKSPF